MMLVEGRSESGAGQGGGSPRGGDGSYFSSGRGDNVGSERGGGGEERRGGVAAAAVAETGGWSDRIDSGEPDRRLCCCVRAWPAAGLASSMFG